MATPAMLPPTAKLNVSAPNPSDSARIAASNETANAFLGIRKPRARSAIGDKIIGNKDAAPGVAGSGVRAVPTSQPSEPHLTNHPRSALNRRHHLHREGTSADRLHSHGQVLPSPTLTNERSPSAAVAHTSPNSFTFELQPGGVRDPNRQPMPGAAGSNPATSRGASSDPSPLMPPTTRSDQLHASATGAVASSPQVSSHAIPQRAIAVIGALESAGPTNSIVPSASPGITTLSSATRKRSRSDNDHQEIGLQNPKRSLVDAAVPDRARRLSRRSFTGSLYVQLEQHIAQFGGLNGLRGELERPRYSNLLVACSRDDFFYIVTHQLYCLWSLDRHTVHEALGSMKPQLVDKAFDHLSKILRSNHDMVQSHLMWLARFPSLSEPSTQSAYNTTAKQVAKFLENLGNRWTEMLDHAVKRGYPITVGDMIHILGCLSPVMRVTLFTVSRRYMGVSDNSSRPLQGLFNDEECFELHAEDGQLGKPNAVRGKFIVAYRQLIAQYRQTHHRDITIATQSPRQQLYHQLPSQGFASSGSNPRIPSNQGDVAQALAMVDQQHRAQDPAQRQYVPQPAHVSPVQGMHLQEQHRILHAMPPQRQHHILPSLQQQPHASCILQDQSSQPGPHLTTGPGQVTPYQMYHAQFGAAGHAPQPQPENRGGNFPTMSPMGFMAPTAVAHPGGSQGQQGQPSPGVHAAPSPADSRRTSGRGATVSLGQTHRSLSSSGGGGQRQRAAPIGVIPQCEYPAGPFDWTSIRIGAHLTRSRSPQRVPDETAFGRYYQYVAAFAVEPTRMYPEIGLKTLRFSLTAEDAARLPGKDTGLSGLPVRSYFEGCTRYRLRCCTMSGVAPTTDAASQDNADVVPESVWAVKKMHWPGEIYAFVNDVVLETAHKQHFHHDMPTELTDYVVAGENVVQLSIPATPPNQLEVGMAFFIAVEKITTARHDALMAQVGHNPHVPEESTRTEIIKRAALLGASVANDDDLIIEDKSLHIGVTDPFSSVLFDVPVRGASCKHLECFDLSNWLMTRTSKPTDKSSQEPCTVDSWLCPICGGDARPPSLRIDDFFAGVRRALVESDRSGARTRRIRAAPDGTWTAMIEPEDEDEEDGGSDGEDGTTAGRAKKVVAVAAAAAAAAPRASPSDRPPREVIEIPDDD